MKRKTKPVRRASRKKAVDSIERGSGNVFADLGLPNADEYLAKANLVHTICDLINSAGLTQKQAAMRLGVDQPKISSLMRGKLKDFSTERLMRFITALDQDVIITIRDPKDLGHPSVRVLVEA